MGVRDLDIFTQAVHAGERASPSDFMPVSTPVYNTVGFLYDSVDDLHAIFAGERAGYVYPRYGNPTVAALEQAVAVLEGADEAVAYASGMAAVLGALLGAGAQQGSTVVAAQDVYGATYVLLSTLMTRLGVRVQFVDAADTDTAIDLIASEKPFAVLVETISNPLLKVADVPRLASAAHAAGAALIVDNTFATPCIFRPLEYGADYVVHSATKYLGGHGDVMAGLVACNAERAKILREQIKLTGANLGPNEAWLTLRGLKTMPLRVRQHSINAMLIASWLEKQPKVERVYYPGLRTHPQWPLVRAMFPGNCYGGMVSFEIRGAGRAEISRFMDALKLILPATTLGDVYTLVLYPAATSHRVLSTEARAKLGITEGLVRLSVGIEDVSDIIADLAQAFESIG
ncbi:MAG: PLP-dependent transferase [Chloroflexi bacterium]|nr:PLP-dependent transferase [Chloroflexota bacterium]